MAINAGTETARSTDLAAEHDRALALVTQRLAGDFPTRAEQVGFLVAEAYARTRDARVQTFRVLLAERAARAELRHGRGPAQDRSFRASA